MSNENLNFISPPIPGPVPGGTEITFTAPLLRLLDSTEALKDALYFVKSEKSRNSLCTKLNRISKMKKFLIVLCGHKLYNSSYLVFR